MYHQVYDPIAGSLVLSTVVALIPIVVLFVLLAGVRMAAQWAGLITLAVALVIAVLVYRMPVGLAIDSALFGAAFGLFPIVWIVINAIFIYNVIVDTGLFDTIRDSLAGLSNDRRIQVVLIAFVFGALLEATAGFGTPVAITGSLMAGLGFEPIYAAALALLANTAPVAFGGFGIPILTAGAVSGLDPMELSQMVGRQTPFLALIIPGMLVTVMAGFRRMLEVLPIVAVSGIAFAATQFLVSNLLGPELADLLAALITVVAVIALKGGLESLERVALRARASFGGQGGLRDAPARTHALRLVSFHHHSRAVFDRADTPDQGRGERHADQDKLSQRRDQRYDWIAGRALARSQRARRADGTGRAEAYTLRRRVRSEE